MLKRTAAILFLCVSSTMLALGIIGPLMPAYAQGLGAGGFWLGLIFAAFPLARAMFMPIIGKASDETGRKRFILTGLALYMAVALLYPLASSVWALVFIRFLHGLASGVVVPIAMAYMGGLTPPGQEGRYMGLMNQAMFMGLAAGPFLGGLLFDASGFHAVFYPLAVLSGLSFLLVAFFLPPSRAQTQQKARGSFRAILANRVIRSLLIFRFINAIGRGALISFFPLLAADRGLTASQIGLGVSASILLTSLLQYPFGVLADRMSRLKLILVGSFASAGALFLLPLCGSLGSFVALMGFMGLSGAVAMPAATALTVEGGKDMGLGASMGLFNTAMSLGMIIAPLLAGVVMQATSIGPVFVVSGLVCLAGALVFWRLYPYPA